MILKVIDNQ